MVALALLLGAMLAPVVSAQSAPEAQGVVGKWAGYVTWPSGGVQRNDLDHQPGRDILHPDRSVHGGRLADVSRRGLRVLV
jgi:hypothetical protein